MDQHILSPSGLEGEDSWSSLCLRCQDLKVQGLASEFSTAAIDVTDRGLQGAKTGCRVCIMISKNISQGKIYSPSGMWPSCTYTDTSTKKRAIASVQAYTCVDGDLMFFAEQDDPAAKSISRRPPLTTYDCEQAYSTIKGWFEECRAHSECPKLEDQILPTRLLDVGSTDQEPFLTFPERGTTGSYAALSYCWGKQQTVTLTQERVNRQDFSFPLSTLPPTLRDAIIICRKLNFQYIWIDALCIIQDSENSEDWQRESAVMDDIYGNATITIAASATKNVSEGIFKFPAEAESGTCSIPYKMLDGQVGKAFVQFFPINADRKQPLAKRAWAYQEGLMSPRVVSFQTNQLVWECNSKRVYGNGISSKVTAPSHRISKVWEQLVEEYTLCEGTFVSDRLTAFSGFVKMRLKNARSVLNVDPTLGDTYVAGLWESNLWRHLIWFLKHGYSPRRRPAVYIAPTFSWASIDQPVTFTSVATREDSGDLGRQGATILRSIGESRIHFIDTSIAVSKLNPFGSIEPSPQSYIRVRGHLKPAIGLKMPNRVREEEDFNPQTPAQTWNDCVVYFDVVTDQNLQYSPAPNFQAGLWARRNFSLWCLRVSDDTALILLPVCLDDSTVKYRNVVERVGIVRNNIHRIVDDKGARSGNNSPVFSQRRAFAFSEDRMQSWPWFDSDVGPNITTVTIV